MAVEKSVIVQGKSIDEALQRAAILLHASTADLAHEVLQQGLVDQHGIVRILYKLRVLPMVSPPSPREYDEFPTEALVPPFSRKQLSLWSNAEFVRTMQAAIAAQPECCLDPPRERAPLSEPPLDIRGGLAAYYGSIVHNGDVIVHGNVSRGVNISASGSILVEGDVDVAQLDAGDNIHIVGGLLGIARSSHSTVSCLFTQGAYIEAKGQINIVESSLHSQLISSNIVDIGGTVIGGTTIGPQAIYARITGSETGVLTKLISGNNNNIREEAEIVRRRASRLVSRLSELSEIIKDLEPLDIVGTKINVDDRLRLWEAMSEKAQLNDKLVALSSRKNTLLALIDQDRTARIKVADTVHPQTQIEIDGVGMTIKKLTQYVTFSKDYEAAALRVTSFR